MTDRTPGSLAPLAGQAHMAGGGDSTPLGGLVGVYPEMENRGGGGQSPSSQSALVTAGPSRLPFLPTPTSQVAWSPPHPPSPWEEMLLPETY